MSALLTESTAVLKERAAKVGLPDDALQRLLDQGVDTLAKLAFAPGHPGESPSDEKLKALVAPVAAAGGAGGADPSLGTVAAVRRLVFEAQTLVVNETKCLVENKEEQPKELPPAERRDRLQKQAARLAGVDLSGVNECSHASYDLCLKLISDNCVSYLQPSKFTCRQAELRMDKPRKELDVAAPGSSSSVLLIKDRAAEQHCDVTHALDLFQALHRRALAMDLVGLSTYARVQEWNSFLRNHLQQPVLAGYRSPTVQQLLHADRAAWVRLSELTPAGVRRKATGELPLDSLWADLQKDPRASHHGHEPGNGAAGVLTWPQAVPAPKLDKLAARACTFACGVEPAAPVEEAAVPAGLLPVEVLPARPDVPPSESAAHPGGSKQLTVFHALEVFAGSARLTVALRAIGLQDSCGVDHRIPRHCPCPMVKLDLTRDFDVQLLHDMIDNPFCLYVHFAPPCGTSSRARLIQETGHDPEPCRDDTFPDGLPDLPDRLAQRVAAANRLYGVTAAALKRAVLAGKLVSCENPLNSFMWQTTAWRQGTSGLSLREAVFDHCCYGGNRPKHTLWVHNVPAFDQLNLTRSPMVAEFRDVVVVTSDHDFLPASAKLPVAVPVPPSASCDPPLPELPTVLVYCVVLHLGVGRRNPNCPVEQFASVCLQQKTILADDVIQLFQLLKSDRLARGAGLDDEFSWSTGAYAQGGVTGVRANLRLNPAVSNMLCQFVKQHAPGHPFSAIMLGRNLQDPNVPDLMGCELKFESNRFRTWVGVPWTCDEFIKQALEAKHPRLMSSGVPPELQQTIDFLASEGMHAVGASRTEALRQWLGRAAELDEQERVYKETLPKHCAKTLGKKRLLLFGEMIEAAGHNDPSLVADMSKGFALGGPIPYCPEFRAKRTAATMAVDETYRVTLDEVERGWLDGPLKESDLGASSLLTRRFGVVQNNKTRPIDNYLESGLNATSSSYDTITVHTADCIASGLARRLRADAKCRLHQLLLKSWDLHKAYKNLPLSLEALEDSFLCVYDPKGKCPRIFRQKVLPFGSRHSVHAFCRVSLGIWKVLVVLFLCQINVFFDDFVGVELAPLARLFDIGVCLVFRLLGWDVAEDKESVFDSCAKVLGLKFDLSESRLGRITLCNTESRRDEIFEALSDILSSGYLTQKDGERIRGRLQFAENQIAGKVAGTAYKQLSRFVLRGGGHLDECTRVALLRLRDRVNFSPPRVICANILTTMHLYVDASCEGDNVGLGGVLVNEVGSKMGFFSERASEHVRRRMNPESGNPIFEYECLAILVGLRLWAPLIRSTNLVVFTDNEGALACMVAGISSNKYGEAIAQHVHVLCDELGLNIWFERVNTCSNVADAPSRGSKDPELGKEFTIDLVRAVEYTIESLGPLSDYFDQVMPDVFALRTSSERFIDVQVALPREGCEYRSTLVKEPGMPEVWSVIEWCEPLESIENLSALLPGDRHVAREVLVFATRRHVAPEEVGLKVCEGSGEPPALPERSSDLPESDNVRMEDGEPLQAEAVEPEPREQVQVDSALRDEPDDEASQPLVVDGVALSMACTLATLRSAANALGLGKSGGKSTVLKRIRTHLDQQQLIAAHKARSQLAEMTERPATMQAEVALPSEAEQKEHAMTHTPYRGWCEHCVSYRAKADRHETRQRDDRAVSTLSFDFAYTSRKDGDKEKLCCLVVCDSATKWVQAWPVERKGGTAARNYMALEITRLLSYLGHRSVTLRCDPEPSCNSLAEAVSTLRSRIGMQTHVENTPAGEHQACTAEGAIEKIRQRVGTLLSEFEQNSGVTIGTLHPLHAWCWRHSGWLLQRFNVMQALTAWERLHQTPYTGKLVRYGEYVLARIRSTGDGQVHQKVEATEDQESDIAGSDVSSNEADVISPGQEDIAPEAMLPELVGVSGEHMPAALPERSSTLPESSPKRQRIMNLVHNDEVVKFEDLGIEDGSESDESVRSLEDEMPQSVPDQSVSSTTGQIPNELWRPFSDHEPMLSAEEQAHVDMIAESFELERLVQMGVLLPLDPASTNLDDFRWLSTKMVKGWRIKAAPEGQGQAFLRRARFVARDFKWMTNMAGSDIFAPASASVLWKLLPAVLVTKQKQGEPWEALALDITDAYLTVPQRVKTVVSVDVGTERKYYQLLRNLPGQRPGAKDWFDSFQEHLSQGLSIEPLIEAPALFRIPAPAESDGGADETGGGLCHVDDVFAVGHSACLDRLEACVRGKYRCTVHRLKGIGQEVEFLKRRHVWLAQGVLGIYPNPKHVTTLATMLGVVSQKPKETPLPVGGTLPLWSKLEPLDQTSSALYRKAIGILLYVAPDLPFAQFAVNTLSSVCGKPNKGAWQCLRHLANYLYNHADYVWSLESCGKGNGYVVRDRDAHVLEVFCDSDWSGNKSTRRSTSAGCLMLNGAPVYSFSRSQACVALSSGEAEYIAMVSGTCDAILIETALRHVMGEPLETHIFTDSSAARGIVSRKGCGRLRHVEGRMLWLQDHICLHRKATLHAIGTTINPADLMTKALSSSRTKFLCHCFGIRSEAEGFDRVGAAEFREHQRQQEVKQFMRVTRRLNQGHGDALKVIALLLQVVSSGATEGHSLSQPLEPHENWYVVTVSVDVRAVITLVVLCATLAFMTRSHQAGLGLRGGCRQAVANLGAWVEDIGSRFLRIVGFATIPENHQPLALVDAHDDSDDGSSDAAAQPDEEPEDLEGAHEPPAAIAPAWMHRELGPDDILQVRREAPVWFAPHRGTRFHMRYDCDGLRNARIVQMTLYGDLQDEHPGRFGLCVLCQAWVRHLAHLGDIPRLITMFTFITVTNQDQGQVHPQLQILPEPEGHDDT
ncbi:unnamed protein product [Symbiodinium natans]|uniref:SAP domain-containing protein n=1 Tax=Symbiodinium natans TaxID=878477 RepID=A0A812SPE2_9DINO|nr:unnamed protein product [Symbiodinium natans]